MYCGHRNTIGLPSSFIFISHLNINSIIFENNNITVDKLLLSLNSYFSTVTVVFLITKNVLFKNCVLSLL